MKRQLLLYIFLLIGLHACDYLPKLGGGGEGGNILQKQEKKNPNYVCDMISNKIHSFSFLMKVNNKQAEHIREETLDTYAANGYNLLWQNEKNNAYSDNIQTLLATLRNAEEQGLNPVNYKVDVMDTLFNQIYQQQKFKEEQVLLNKIDLDLSLTASALAFISDLSNGQLKHKWDIPKSKSNLSQVLISALAKNEVKDVIQQITPKFIGYDGMVKAFNKYKKIKKDGGFPKITTSGLAYNKTNKAAGKLAHYLYLTGDYPDKVEKGVSIKYDKKLKDAVKNFQKRYGISASGSVNNTTLKYLNTPIDETLKLLELNLERYRWLPDDLGERYVFVNIPEFMIKVVEDDKQVLDMRAVVGETSSRTEIFTQPITHIVFSPIWNIPQSISRDDIIKWLDVNPGVLYVGDVLSYYKGKLIEDPYSVDWKAARKDWRNYTFKQQPTEQNSLGDVKFMFPNKYSIYLHDTPAKEYFQNRVRAESAGCVRVAEPVNLAKFLLDDQSSWSTGRIKNAMAGTKQRWAHLTKPVPVYLYYLTAFVDKEGQLNFRPDLYRHDRRQMKKFEL